MRPFLQPSLATQTSNSCWTRTPCFPCSRSSFMTCIRFLDNTSFNWAYEHNKNATIEADWRCEHPQ